MLLRAERDCRAANCLAAPMALEREFGFGSGGVRSQQPTSAGEGLYAVQVGRWLL